jgi:hypothetical protein
VSCTGKIFVCRGNVCETNGGKIFVSCTGKCLCAEAMYVRHMEVKYLCHALVNIFVCGGNVCEVWSVMRPPSRANVRGTCGPMELAVASDAMTSL